MVQYYNLMFIYILCRTNEDTIYTQDKYEITPPLVQGMTQFLSIVIKGELNEHLNIDVFQ